MTTTTLGEPRFASPFRRTVSDLASRRDTIPSGKRSESWATVR